MAQVRGSDESTQRPEKEGKTRISGDHFQSVVQASDMAQHRKKSLPSLPTMAA